MSVPVSEGGLTGAATRSTPGQGPKRCPQPRVPPGHPNRGTTRSAPPAAALRAVIPARQGLGGERRRLWTSPGATAFGTYSFQKHEKYRSGDPRPPALPSGTREKRPRLSGSTRGLPAPAPRPQLGTVVVAPHRPRGGGRITTGEEERKRKRK